jgi:Holliday junction DNA helicase RuvA
VISETFEALRMLGHSESDARRLVDNALKTKKKFKDVGELIAAIYDQSKE